MEINLEPGNYWFYGYDNDESEKAKFYQFLECLKETYLVDYRGFGFCTGHYEDSGIFYFTLQEKLTPTTLFWCSKYTGGGDSLFENIKNSHSRICWEDRLFEEKYSSFLKISKGITECSEKCIFYYMCDGNRESPLNPSSILPGVSCQKYDFSNITEKI